MILFVSAAFAAGFYTADSGVIDNGMGSTGVTGVESPFTVYYNPAGLERIRRPTFSFGGSGCVQNIAFERWDADGTKQPVVENAGNPLVIPEFGFATPFGKDKFVFAIGLTSPTAPDYAFPKDGAQRYSMIDSVVWSFQFGPGLSWQPKKWLTVGAAFQWQVLRIQQHLDITTNGKVDGSGDVEVVAAVWDKFTPGWNAGVVVEPIDERLRIGASFQPALNYLGTGNGSLDFTGNGLENFLDQKVWTDDEIRLAIKMPMVIRIGASGRPIEPLELAGEFVYEDWSAIREIRISDIDVTVTGSNGLINQKVPEEIPLPAGFEAAWSVRLGAELAVHERLTLRAGGLYETSSLSHDRVSVSLVDTPKVLGSLGGTVWAPKDRVAFDFYGNLSHFQHLEITDSQVTQVTGFEGVTPAVVGNGDLRASGFALGGAVRVFLGPSEPRAVLID